MGWNHQLAISRVNLYTHLFSGHEKKGPQFTLLKINAWRIILFSKWLYNYFLIVRPLSVGLWDPLQMAELHGL